MTRPTDPAAILRDYLRASALDPGRASNVPERLDRRSEPNPFRRYPGAPRVDLARSADDSTASEVPWDDARAGRVDPAPLDAQRLGAFLDDALGVVGWREKAGARFAFRACPSAGNRQPIETHVVTPPLPGLADTPALWHFDVFGHALERRLAPLDLDTAKLPSDGSFFVALAAIPWRSAWKYGERAFRLALLDAGHALAALAVSAAIRGWRVRRLKVFDEDLEALLGTRPARSREAVDREPDPEQEIPLVLVEIGPDRGLGSGPTGTWRLDPGERAALLDAPRAGRATRVSRAHRSWPALEAAVRATRRPADRPAPSDPVDPVEGSPVENPPAENPPAVDLVRSRRSHARFDRSATGSIALLLRILRAATSPRAPGTLAVPGSIQLLVFVHRIDGLEPGLYAFRRSGLDRLDFGPLRAALRDDLAWRSIDASGSEPAELILLAPGDARRAATHLVGDQDAGGDSLFTVAMLAPLEQALTSGAAPGGEPWIYRDRHFEAGELGHRLYLEAGACGLVATGLAGFWDDRFHAWLGLPSDPAAGDPGPFFRVLYLLAVGAAFEPAPALESPEIPRRAECEPVPASRGGYRAAPADRARSDDEA